ncbi:hypothetical protein J6590_067257 [Homalodisca vitripennis]|nr:hypothetical protein J6590_067257 [Homalodisca vitripennis]
MYKFLASEVNEVILTIDRNSSGDGLSKAIKGARLIARERVGDIYDMFSSLAGGGRGEVCTCPLEQLHIFTNALPF